jgi:hypothetical protein
MVEQTKYEIIEDIGKIEIRRYPKIIIVKVNDNVDESFNILFRYINGNNLKKSNIEMTAPVLSEKVSMTSPIISEIDSLAFILPHHYTMKNVPIPFDERVKIIEISERVVAVLRFSGLWSNSLFEKMSKELLQEIEKRRMKTKGPIFSMRYNHPSTPSYLRRNEVAIEINF